MEEGAQKNMARKRYKPWSFFLTVTDFFSVFGGTVFAIAACLCLNKLGVEQVRLLTDEARHGWFICMWACIAAATSCLIYMISNVDTFEARE